MSDNELSSGEELIKRLYKGKLPQMVDWFDPLVLGLVAMRTLISTTIGQYADQRPMQEAADGEQNDGKLVTRHDYSKRAGPNQIYPPDADPNNLNYALLEDNAVAGDAHINQARAERRLILDDNALWVDFIADLGDGFEATYAMASLLAPATLSVRGVDKELPAGQILIFGGDLAYPNATLEEYRARCLDPYDWVFTADRLKAEPDRELFFIAGNHDWYDGLSAFTTQFCYEASSVGGWRCRQERSYFALRLPYDWWIWGVDVALGDNIDVGQLHYFQKVVASLDENQNAKILIILHAPDWSKPVYKALSKICELAREKAEICAIIAGDLHHYSRYQSSATPARDGKTPIRDQPLHLITAGGGGAFAHPTHDRKRTLEIDPAVASRRRKATGLEAKGERREGGKYQFEYQKFYPSKAKSRLLALRNIALPVHNWRFALLVGLVYLLYGWVFNVTPAKDADVATASSGLAIADAAAVATAAQDNPTFFFMLLGLWLGLIYYVDANISNRFLRWLNGPLKVVFGTLHFSAHLAALLFVSALSFLLAAKVFNPLIGMATLSGKLFIDNIVQGIAYSAGGERYLEEMHACLRHLGWGAHAQENASCAIALLKTNAFYIAAKALTLAAISIIVGGLIGAFIFGCYWVITSVLFGMHPDAFSALAIKDYKNFLRMKFEEDKVTIYPIALDRVPMRWEWRAGGTKADLTNEKLKHSPLIVPWRELRPRLIEGPIEILRPGKPPSSR